MYKMETSSSTSRNENGINKFESKDNLELYLNDTYKNECVFKIEDDEVNFIQNGIEALAQIIVDLLLTDEEFCKFILKEAEKRWILTEHIIEHSLNSKSLPESLKGKYKKSSLIKAGSFYEGTKNSFPDEFDFMFLLFRMQHGAISFSLCQTSYLENIRRLCFSNSHLLHFPGSHGSSTRSSSNRSLQLDCGNVIKANGPACKLTFIYINDSGKHITINVDLVPACIVTGGSVNISCDSKVQYIKSSLLCAEGCYYIGGRPSISDIELPFVREVLSEKHIKLYRVLKFLINGRKDSEYLRNYMLTFGNGRGKGYSSYMIKTMMFFHHYDCISAPESGSINHCLLQVLQDMLQHEIVNTFPRLHWPNNLGMYYDDNKLVLRPYLQEMYRYLKELHVTTNPYDYKSDKLEISVSRKYLDVEKAKIQSKQKEM